MGEMMPDQEVGGGRYFAADRESDQELARLQRLEEICDPWTFLQMELLGVGTGGRYLEVGAGAGSVTRWLADRAAPIGRVVAVDLDPRFLIAVGDPIIEVRRCDITHDDLETDHYDLVHARALVMHMSDPAEVLQKMVTALRPGGVLVIEDPDYGSMEAADSRHPLAAAFDKCFRARTEFCLAAGIMNLRFGRSLPVLFDRLYLDDVGNAAYTASFHGADTASQFLLDTFAPLDQTLIAAGAATSGDIADAQRALADPTFIYRAALMQFAWGRKPSI
jgi:SAM-dependent methyltransferase